MIRWFSTNSAADKLFKPPKPTAIDVTFKVVSTQPEAKAVEFKP